MGAAEADHHHRPTHMPQQPKTRAGGGGRGELHVAAEATRHHRRTSTGRTQALQAFDVSVSHALAQARVNFVQEGGAHDAGSWHIH